MNFIGFVKKPDVRIVKFENREIAIFCMSTFEICIIVSRSCAFKFDNINRYIEYGGYVF